MLIKRVYNNNVVLVTDDSGAECVAVGRGLAFSKRAGDEVDQSMVEKVYTLDSEENRTRFENLIKSIPVEYLTVADEIVSMVQRESDLHVGDNLLIALADHISLSLERERAGVPCENPLLMEIKQFYKREFALARRAAGIIHERMGIWISEGGDRLHRAAHRERHDGPARRRPGAVHPHDPGHLGHRFQGLFDHL